MIGAALRVLAALLVVGASYVASGVVWARMDSWDEVVLVLRLDTALGFAFALALLLCFGPGCMGAPPKRWLLLAASAALIGGCVSGPLLYLHWTQYRIRSTPPVPHSVES